MISDYAELVMEATSRVDDGRLTQRAPMLVGMAEAELNKKLRVGEMEESTTFVTDANGETFLPTDFLQPRSVRKDGKELMQYSLRAIRTEEQCGYAIAGTFFASSYPDASISMDYYEALPGLQFNETNWLLQSDSEMYLQAVIKQCYIAKMDMEKAAAVDTYLQRLIDERQQQDGSARYKKTQFVIAGQTP